MDDLLASTVEPVLVISAFLCGVLIRRSGILAVTAIVIGLLHGALLDMVSATGGFHGGNLVLGVAAALVWAFIGHAVRSLLTRRRAG